MRHPIPPKKPQSRRVQLKEGNRGRRLPRSCSGARQRNLRVRDGGDQLTGIVQSSGRLKPVEGTDGDVGLRRLAVNGRHNIQESAMCDPPSQNFELVAAYDGISPFAGFKRPAGGQFTHSLALGNGYFDFHLLGVCIDINAQLRWH